MILKDNQLQKDYAKCEEVISHNSKSFYSAFKKLSRDDANAVYAIYSFCRIVDDYADVDQSLLKVENFSAEFEKLLNQGNDSTYYWRALTDVFNRYSMTSEPFFDQITGQKFDLTGGSIEDEEDLSHYCYLVAGSVGLMMLPIICEQMTDQAKEISLKLGEAMQITNILRDVGSDILIDRRYLPTSLLIRFAYTENELMKNVINQNFIDMLEYLMTKAEQMYLYVEQNINVYKKEAQYAILLALYYYRAIINKIRNNNYDVFNKRAVVSSLEKLSIAKRVNKLV